MEGWMEGWMEGRMDGRMDGRMNGRMDGRMDGWMDGRMDGWMDGRTGGKMHGRMGRSTNEWVGRLLDDGEVERLNWWLTGKAIEWANDPSFQQFTHSPIIQSIHSFFHPLMPSCPPSWPTQGLISETRTRELIRGHFKGAQATPRVIIGWRAISSLFTIRPSIDGSVLFAWCLYLFIYYYYYYYCIFIFYFFFAISALMEFPLMEDLQFIIIL